ncbi:hypothetical protein DPMN_128074 [Dreissena polymorpha]|uniref:Uncharacterized protein n=1 Tax=Dreissena polymorpha TaxID=45954 RepID=A0A9D4H060_DREPO|nr:hypothetical protein DPMN_128074 [Dreissena polymorpha]
MHGFKNYTLGNREQKIERHNPWFRIHIVSLPSEKWFVIIAKAIIISGIKRNNINTQFYYNLNLVNTN